jgi:hypothetical protein
MLDPRFKTFHFVSLLISHDQGKAIVEEYDKKSLFLRCCYHLHLLAKFENGVVDQSVEEDNNLDIFEMTFNICEPTMNLMNRELLIFKRCQVDVKNIKWPFQRWEKHESMFV